MAMLLAEVTVNSCFANEIITDKFVTLTITEHFLKTEGMCWSM